jgi:hypothetical protein
MTRFVGTGSSTSGSRQQHAATALGAAVAKRRKGSSQPCSFKWAALAEMMAPPRRKQKRESRTGEGCRQINGSACSVAQMSQAQVFGLTNQLGTGTLQQGRSGCASLATRRSMSNSGASSVRQQHLATALGAAEATRRKGRRH